MKKLLLLLCLLAALPVCGANWYLSSVDGNDADDGSTWAAAKATLTNVLALMAAGDTCYVTNGHVESFAAAMTLTNNGTETAPVHILCVADNNEPPTTLSTGAKFSTTGANALTINGTVYCYGMTFECGTGAVGANLLTGQAAFHWSLFDRCTFALLTTAGSAQVVFGSSTIGTVLREPTFKFSAVGQTVSLRGRMEWTGGSIDSSGTAPTSLFSGTTQPVLALFTDVDFSHLGSGKNLVVLSGGAPYNYYFQDCKLGASVSVGTGTPVGPEGPRVTLVNCDSADTQYRYHKQTYQGTITHETTNIRTNGATDGTTPISRRMVTTANSQFYSPLESDPISFWNETVGSALTVTIPVMTATDNTWTNTDAQLWMEVSYLGIAGVPLATNKTTRAADILATPAALTVVGNDGWNTNGVPFPVFHNLSATFTPQEKGVVRVCVKGARASTTNYFDPRALVSGRQYQHGPYYVNEGKRETSFVGP